MCWRAEAQGDLPQHLSNLTIADTMLHIKGFFSVLRKKGKQREAVINKQEHFLQEQVFGLVYVKMISSEKFVSRCGKGIWYRMQKAQPFPRKTTSN